MSMVLYSVIIILIVLLVALIALLLLRLRVRFEISGQRRLLFVGLGRSGPELDLLRKQGVIKLFGWRVREFVMERRESDRGEVARRVVRRVTGEQPAETTEPSKAPAGMNWREILDLVPSVGRAMALYIGGLLKSAIVEEARGRIEAGFDEPHVTGQAYGYYRAVLAMAPATVGRLEYIPDWTGASFDGSAQVAVAMPLYQVTGRTLVLLWRLPKRRIYRLIREAKHRRKGVDDGGQSRS